MDGYSKKISVLSAVETILTHTSKGPLTSDCSCSWISEFPIALLSERWWKDKHIQMWREIVLVPHHIYNRIPTKNRNRDVLKKENCSFQKAAVVSLWGRKHEDCSRLMKTREGKHVAPVTTATGSDSQTEAELDYGATKLVKVVQCRIAECADSEQLLLCLRWFRKIAFV